MKTREFTFLFEERKKKERRSLPQKLLDHCLTIRAFSVQKRHKTAVPIKKL